MKKAYLLLLAGMLSTAVFAGSKQTVKIDGQVIEKTVSEITFDGDNVVLQYSDNTCLLYTSDGFWSGLLDSNQRPHRPERRALPTALNPDFCCKGTLNNG